VRDERKKEKERERIGTLSVRKRKNINGNDSEDVYDARAGGRSNGPAE
jgi:hypothetical protein